MQSTPLYKHQERGGAEHPPFISAQDREKRYLKFQGGKETRISVILKQGMKTRYHVVQDSTLKQITEVQGARRTGKEGKIQYRGTRVIF